MGFFIEDQPKAAIERKPKAIKRQELSGVRGCVECPVREAWPRLASPQMRMDRPKDADILILGAAPGPDDDMKGRPCTGDTWAQIARAVPARERDRLAFQNVVRCQTPKPDAAGAYSCGLYLEDDIDALHPAGILGMGQLAFGSLVNDLTGGDATVYDAHGIWFPVKVKGQVYWFMPVFEYAALLNKDGTVPKHGTELNPIWPVLRANIRTFFTELDRLPAPTIDEIRPEEVVIVNNLQDAENFYARMDPRLIACDVETKGLRPYNKDALLLSSALSDGNLTMAYAVDHPEQKNPWAVRFTVDALHAADKWAGHNSAFELAWLAYYGDLEMNPDRIEDSMAIARLKFQRVSMGSLECVSRAILGVNIKRLTGVNAKRIMDYPLHQVLPYNGLDALASARIVKKERHSVNDSHYARLIGGEVSTTMMQLMGLPVDEATTLALKQKWESSRETAIKAASTLYEVRRWTQETQQEFNLSKDEAVAEALVTYGKVVLPKGAGRTYKCDEETLLAAAPDNPLVQATLQYREADKALSTYINPYLEIPKQTKDGLLHPCYTVLLVRTFRLSSEDPNIQNVPSRSNRELRSQLKAPPGHIYVSFDYGQIQVRIVGMESQDAALLDFILTGHDMHSDWRNQMLNDWPEYFDHVQRRCKETKEEKILKAARNEIKNDFVFASLFGSLSDSCARRMKAPPQIMKDLQARFFARHPDVQRWHKRQRQFYQETGSSRIITGHIRHGIMSGNEPINTPIQGAEAMVLLDSMNDCAALSRERKDPYLHPCMQIHDDLTFIWPDDNRIYGYIDDIVPILTACRYPWQILPWSIEAKAGPNWSEMEEFAVFTGEYHR